MAAVIIAARRARIRRGAPLTAEPARDLAADEAVPAARGDPGAGRYRGAAQALQRLRGGGRGRRGPRCLPASRRGPARRGARTIRTTKVTRNAGSPSSSPGPIRYPAAPGAGGELISCRNQRARAPQRDSPGEPGSGTREGRTAAAAPGDGAAPV